MIVALLVAVGLLGYGMVALGWWLVAAIGYMLVLTLALGFCRAAAAGDRGRGDR